MTKFTKERLEEIAFGDSEHDAEKVEMARQLLAGLEQEPVAKAPELSKVIYHFRDWNEGFPVEKFKADYVISWMLANYPPAPPSAAPQLPQPAVPDENGLLPCPFCGGKCDAKGWAGIAPGGGLAHGPECENCGSTADSLENWNRRAAMLQGAEPVQAWIPCSERMPEEIGRYWCYVEEQNSLGKSHYQWNCSWNGDRWWVESENGGRVTHWMPLQEPPKQTAES